MARGGRRPGAGRPKGHPNLVTAQAHSIFLRTFQNLEKDLEQWIRTAAEENPAKAADLLIRMAEYHFPKQGRLEVAGDGGGPVEFVIRDIAKEST